MTVGARMLIGGGAVGGVIGAVLQRSPVLVRRSVIAGVSAVVVAGVFQELIQLMLQYEGPIGAIRDFCYTWEGLSPQGAAVIFVVAAVAAARPRRSVILNDQQRQRQRMIGPCYAWRDLRCCRRWRGRISVRS